MKIIVLAFSLLCCAPIFAKGQRSYKVPTYHAPRSASVYVRSHVTKTGTYVAPSYRTTPNATKADNWSSKPNFNPYTGKAGTKDPYAAPTYGH